MSEANTRAARRGRSSVKEGNAGGKEGAHQNVHCRILRNGLAAFEVSNCGVPNSRGICQFLLGPIQNSARGSALCGCDHIDIIQGVTIFAIPSEYHLQTELIAIIASVIVIRYSEVHPMSNTLTKAIAAFHTANAAIPVTAPDAEMDAAVDKASAALDLAIRVPAFTVAEVQKKLALAGKLTGWPDHLDRLADRCAAEMLAARHREAVKTLLSD